MGSVAELDTQLRMALAMKLIAKERAEELLLTLDHHGRKLNKLIQVLQKRESR